MEPMRSREDGEMTRAYAKLYTRLEAVGIKLKINIMDNEASHAVKAWLTKRKTVYQICAPGGVEAIEQIEPSVISKRA